MSHNRLYSAIVTGIFALCLVVITVFSVVLEDRVYSDSERRNLQQMPTLSLDTLFAQRQPKDSRRPEKRFTTLYETYVADQFVLRDEFVSLKNQTELLLGKRDMNGIYIGSDDYLFNKQETLDTALLNSNLEIVADFLDALRAQQTIDRVAVTLAPESAHILTEKLPPFAGVYDFSSVDAAGNALLGDDYVSVFEALCAQKNNPIYYRTDHHWTMLGAHAAYTELSTALGFSPSPIDSYRAETVSQAFKGTYSGKVNLPIDNDEIVCYSKDSMEGLSVVIGKDTHSSVFSNAALETTDQYNFFLYGNHAVTTIDTDMKNNKTLLVIKDSYAHSLIPYLCEHYERIVSIDLRSFNESTLALCSEQEITDVLVLYQATNFVNAEDKSILQLKRN